mmetsp:Transcript_68837/g.223130  ORF Transcript_68837/g.223130 Transcript_68837/m.223130 type:complete len:224 (+) Transcript_68837:396-1067(+)
MHGDNPAKAAIGDVECIRTAAMRTSRCRCEESSTANASEREGIDESDAEDAASLGLFDAKMQTPRRSQVRQLPEQLKSRLARHVVVELEHCMPHLHRTRRVHREQTKQPPYSFTRERSAGPETKAATDVAADVVISAVAFALALGILFGRAEAASLLEHRCVHALLARGRQQRFFSDQFLARDRGSGEKGTTPETLNFRNDHGPGQLLGQTSHHSRRRFVDHS